MGKGASLPVSSAGCSRYRAGECWFPTEWPCFYTMHGKQGGTTDLFYLPLHRRNSVQGQFCFSTLRGEGNMKIDLMKEKIAPLYYPVTPMNGQMNLFSVIFQLLGENKIKAYEYLDGYEEFDEAHLINFKDLLDRFYILYEEIPGRAGEEPTFVINESDIPAADVRSYYVKEAWYFDQNNSAFDVKILAICPILTSTGDMGETTMPMFWLPYENIRPYISNSYIMTSNMNNAMTFTMDDYFRRRMFEGDIIKTQNLMNLPLQAYCPTPDSLKNEQARIEGQLTGFEKSLWYQPDTTQVAVDSKAAKKARKSAARGNGTTTKEPASE